MRPSVISHRRAAGRTLPRTEAQRIAEALGCLPLALSHAAADLRDGDNATPDSYLAALSEHMKDVPESADYPRAVFTTLMENTRQRRRGHGYPVAGGVLCA